MSDCTCFRELILMSTHPIVFRQLLKWDLIKWNLQEWSRALGGKKYPFRKGFRLHKKEPLWESSCSIELYSFPEFFEFCSNEQLTTKHFLYLDYKHLIDSFNDVLGMFESVSWAEAGFPERNAKNSTIWVGSPGAYTPCHIDTYGFNMVAQVHGRKRWILFPPSETKNLKPTRVPYEESSIYSDVNFACYDSLEEKEFKNCYLLDLDPGDVLFVPARWWHHVENLSTAISINTWIPHENDKHWQLEEALVKYYISSLISFLPENLRRFLLNPNELDIEEKQLVHDILMICRNNCRNEIKKKMSINVTSIYTYECHVHRYAFVPRISSDEMKRVMKKECENLEHYEEKNNDIYSKIIVDEFKCIINLCCHPNAIRELKIKMLQP